MEINREALIQDLERFAVSGNGIVIGKPGVGKSHSLLKLKKLFKEKGIPHLFLPIDQLGDGSDEELHNLLDFEGDLISKLQEEINSLRISPGIILFDAFDAARNEEIRNRFVRLINRIISELKGLWNVIVTVRTYDALKSEKLLRLFGEPLQNPQSPYNNKDVECRHFMIPPLNEDELMQAVAQIPRLDIVYENASTDLKDLFKIPFNLWLIEKIFKNSSDLPDMSRVKSEVQLLGMFWKERVRKKNDCEKRESILTRLVKNMLYDYSLSIRKEKVYNISEDETWTQLYSDEILIELSSSKQRISFSHNILFDYAVSILVIDDGSKELKEFILEDPSRPVFLRPSLDYYFTRLWNDYPVIFWDIYRDILLDDDINLRTFTRLIPPIVIVREARELHEFDRLAVIIKENKKSINKGILSIITANFALKPEYDLLWIQYLEMISNYIGQEFAWDMTRLATSIFDKVQNTGNNEVIEICGRVARSILVWVWQRRKENQEWFDRLGALWAVPLVAKTFKTDIPASTELIEQIFYIAGNEKFPIQYFSNIIRHIEFILPHNLAVVSRIYQVIFEYQEVSEEKTDLGGNIVSLSSTRRQDFGMCQYGLKEHFPAFLEAAPLVAVKTAMHFLNAHFIKEHITGYLKAGIQYESLLQKFTFRGKDAYLISDNSAIWDSGNLRKKSSLEIADMIFNFLAKKAESQQDHKLLESFLDLFCENHLLAFFWKRLLETGVRLPKVFAPFLFEICIAKPIQVDHSTIHQLGIFIEKASEHFTEKQLVQIEKSILDVTGKDIDNEDREYIEYKRNRLLACIPEKRLITEDAKKIIGVLRETDRIPKNEPEFKMTTFTGTVTDEDWLVRKGVKIEKEENQQLIKYLEPLDNFSSNWKEGSQDDKSRQEFIKIIEEVFQKLRNAPLADHEVIYSLWNKLASAAVILSSSKLEPGSREFQLCRNILLMCKEHEEPSYREGSEIDFARFPSWSPAPRIEAASGLPDLAAVKPDEEILSAIETLASDKVPAVRYQIAIRLDNLFHQNQEYFWRLTEKFAGNEKNYTIQNALCKTLWNVAKYDEDRTAKILGFVINSYFDQEVNDISHGLGVSLLVRFFFSNKNQWANRLINSLLEKEEAHTSFLIALVFEISKYLAPELIVRQRDRVDMAIDVLKKILDISLEHIQEFSANSEKELNPEQQARLTNSYQIFDEIIMRLYFHSSIDETDHANPIPDEQLKTYYFKVKPLLERAVSADKSKRKILLAAHTAHYFMSFLNNILKFDPKGALHLAAEVVISSKPNGYNLEILAIREVVKIVETILADHREEVKEPSTLSDLLSLLDIFAETGWPEAIQLTSRLGEIFR